MKKSFLKITALAACLGALLFSSTACDFFATDPDGRTPYDVAVSNGYEGTKESWLAMVGGASSKERQWYEEARAAGEFDGTFLEFLQSIGAADGDCTVAASTARLSSVSIYSFFQTSYMMGSGVIFSLNKERGDAYIVTNYHCVYSASEKVVSDKINVYLYGNENPSGANAFSTGNICAEYIGCAESYDIAVLKISGVRALYEGAGAVYMREVTCGDSDAVTAGESVIAVGNAIGKGITATRGIVSVEREEVVTYTTDGTRRITIPEIRTDAAINHGNSGGGLFNNKGELVGIVNARLDHTSGEGASESDSISGFGYAIPSNLALGLARSIVDNGGACMRAELGFDFLEIPAKTYYDEASNRFFTEESLILNFTLSMSGAGYVAGMRNGDTVISATRVYADGGTGDVVYLTQKHRLDELLITVRLNDTVRFVVSRSGAQLTFDVVFSSPSFFEEIE